MLKITKKKGMKNPLESKLRKHKVTMRSSKVKKRMEAHLIILLKMILKSYWSLIPSQKIMMKWREFVSICRL
jgi:hypothetical protein